MRPLVYRQILKATLRNTEIVMFLLVATKEIFAENRRD